MTNKEYRLRRQQQNDSRTMASFAKRSSQSKRTVKGKSHHVNVPLKHSRVYSLNPNILKWSPHTYKAISPSFNCNNPS